MTPLYTQKEFENATSRQKLPLQCKNCEKIFYLPKNKILSAIKSPNKQTGEFCSQSCNKLHHNPPIFVTCKQCAKRFTKCSSQIKKSKNHFAQNHVPQNTTTPTKPPDQEGLNSKFGLSNNFVRYTHHLSFTSIAKTLFNPNLTSIFLL